MKRISQLCRILEAFLFASETSFPVAAVSIPRCGGAPCFYQTVVCQVAAAVAQKEKAVLSSSVGLQ